VILMDRSGSMKGVRLEIARSTVKTILNTLTDDDYFNIITVTLLCSVKVKMIIVLLNCMTVPFLGTVVSYPYYRG